MRNLALMTKTFVALLASFSFFAMSASADVGFYLRVHNNTDETVRFSVGSTGFNCFDGSPKPGHDLGPVEPNAYVDVWLLRAQNSACIGEQGQFGIAIEGKFEMQLFSFDNAGGMYQLNFPTEYVGRLGPKDPVTGIYEWAYEKPESRVFLTPIQYLANKGTNNFLLQSYGATRDDKRNVEAWPNKYYDASFRWAFDNSSPGGTKIFNIKSGLMLTQDNYQPDSNVSTWGVLPGDHRRQRWTIIDAPRTDADGRQHFATEKMIQNVATKTYLVNPTGNDARVSRGTSWGDSNAIWENVTFQDAKGVQGGAYADLARLKIISVKAIATSSGKDGATDVLFEAIDAAAEAAIGAATGGSSLGATTAAKSSLKATIKAAAGTARNKLAQTLTKDGVKALAKSKIKEYTTKEGLKKTLSKKFVKTVALRTLNGAADGFKPTLAEKYAGYDTGQDDVAGTFSEFLFDGLYGESPDQLEIKVNGVSVWPNGGGDWRDIESQETLPVNIEYVFERQRGIGIQLVDVDYGSDDDSLGWTVLDTRDLVEKQEHRDVLIGEKDEQSLYEITFTVEPFEKMKIPSNNEMGGYVHSLDDANGTALFKRDHSDHIYQASADTLRRKGLSGNLSVGDRVRFIVDGGIDGRMLREVWVPLGEPLMGEVKSIDARNKFATITDVHSGREYMLLPSTMADQPVRAGQGIVFYPQYGVSGRRVEMFECVEGC